MSTSPTAAYATSMATWPGPGTGSGSSASSKTSGPPKRVTPAARMAGPPLLDGQRHDENEVPDRPRISGPIRLPAHNSVTCGILALRPSPATIPRRFTLVAAAPQRGGGSEQRQIARGAGQAARGRRVDRRPVAEARDTGRGRRDG